MSATSFDTIAVVLPNPQFDNSKQATLVNQTYGYELDASSVIRTLSDNNPNNFDIIQGLLYVPGLPSGDNSCTPADLSTVPANVTSRVSFPPDDYPFIALAPWTTPQCVQSFLQSMRSDAVRGAIFYHPDGSNAEPPPDSDPSWYLQDAGAWTTQNQFPVYALPGAIGASLMIRLGQYSGNMSSAPNGSELIQLYDSRDTVRLYARMNVSATGGIPSLWIFLIIVLAVLLGIVLVTSFIMHFVQRGQRRSLSRRIAAGEVDLEAFGIKRLNVPQEELDKMPQYTFTSKAEGNIPVPGAREVPFTQPTCPICLDDFIHGETSVRELPCNHIFHAECIDPFLRDNSSLCPMCKKSALPLGACPVHVTNMMVRRERLIRRMRQRQEIENGTAPLSRRATMISAMQRRVRTLSTPSGAVLSSNTQGTHRMNGSNEMQHIQSTSLGRISNPSAPPPAVSGAQGIEPEVPTEVAAQGASARRAWLRQRLARQQEQEYTAAAAEARAVDERRPLWRRIAGRFNSRWE